MKNILIKSFLLITVLLSPVTLFSEESSTNDLIDIENPDDLFNTSEDQSDQTDDDEETSAIDKILSDQPRFTLNANFQIFAGYSPGIENLWPDAGEQIKYSDTFLLGLTSLFTLNFRISNDFRVLQKISISYPNFIPEVTEFFADYTAGDFLFLRTGIQKIKWGESRIYPFTNLPGRLPDGFKGDDKAIAVKASFPYGIGGTDILLLTRKGLWGASKLPELDSLGLGLKTNFILKSADLNLGAYYNYRMNIRAFSSLKTTIFDNTELYIEGLVSVNPDLETYYPGNGVVDNPVDFSGDIGIFTSFTGSKIDLGLEYFFNGEETELKTADEQFPLIKGNNLALSVSFLTGKGNAVRLFSNGMYNIESASALIASGITWDISKEFVLSWVFSFILGDSDKGYFLENPDPLQREFFSAFRLIFHGRI